MRAFAEARALTAWDWVEYSPLLDELLQEILPAINPENFFLINPVKIWSELQYLVTNFKRKRWSDQRRVQKKVRVEEAASWTWVHREWSILINSAVYTVNYVKERSSMGGSWLYKRWRVVQRNPIKWHNTQSSPRQKQKQKQKETILCSSLAIVCIYHGV